MLSGPSESHYAFKASAFSSHSLLVNALPAEGAGRRLLDVGCAGGYLSAIFADRGYHVLGLERPGGTGDNFPRQVDLVEADLEHGLPRLEGAFHYVVCADILEHLRDPARILRQTWAVLEPDGCLVASLPNSGHLYFRLNVLLGRFPQDDKGLFDRTHVRFYMWRGWVDLLQSGGFRVESVRPTGTPIGLAFPALEGSWLVNFLERVSYGMARLWKTLFAYQFIVVARPEAMP
ncbi:MAG: class I SAM-dependent methyltransferase [Bryobacteraceae bacterium]|nr:class I SAM-dependent methyltransferase [Bryobacteraceae bacterium]